MSNLGDYQSFTTEAPRHGGVQGYLNDIRQSAVEEAAAKQKTTGAIVGGAAVLAIGFAVKVSKIIYDQAAAKREAHRLAAIEAEQKLSTLVNDDKKNDGTGNAADAE